MKPACDPSTRIGRSEALVQLLREEEGDYPWVSRRMQDGNFNASGKEGPRGILNGDSR